MNTPTATPMHPEALLGADAVGSALATSDGVKDASPTIASPDGIEMFIDQLEDSGHISLAW